MLIKTKEMDFELENNKKEEPGMKDRSNRVKLR
jgi:hypothetical protein